MSGGSRSVSVVVATVSDSPLLRRCLKALVGQEYQPVEIIVVDNGSAPPIRAFLEADFPGVRYLRLEENRGFAGGYNHGIEAARGDYVAVINDDAVAEPRWISALVEAVERDERTGAVASLVIDGNQGERLDSCGVGIALDGMSRQAFRGVAMDGFKPPDEVLLPSASACLYRRAALEEVGLFDEDFFAYCEDTDLGLRLRKAGWRAAAAPEARVRHYYSRTAGRASLNKLFWVERNHYWVVLKNFPLVLMPLVPLVTIWRFVLQAWLMLANKGGLREFAAEGGFSSVFWTVIRAHVAALAGAPKMIRKRFRAKSRAKLGGIDTAGLILEHRISTREVLTGPKNARD